MSKTRKGFTLVELMIVITIIGILSSMGMISGSQAQNTAKATKIIEGFKGLTTAMAELYAEDPTSADKLTASDVAKIVTGAQKYINKDEVIAQEAAVGVYSVEVKGSNWWLVYTLPSSDEDAALNALLKAKAKEFALKSEATENPKDADPYDGENKVYYCAH